MARLVAVQKMLKSLDIEFTYEEYNSGNIVEVIFKDSLGEEQAISSTEGERTVHIKNRGFVKNQQAALEWIEDNKGLLTDEAEGLRIKEERERRKRKREESKMIVEEWKFEKEGYKLEIRKRKSGYIEFQSFNTRRGESHFIPEIYINNALFSEGDNVSVVIQTTSYGSLNGEEAKEFMTEFQRGFEAMNYFNEKLNEILNKNNN